MLSKFFAAVQAPKQTPKQAPASEQRMLSNIEFLSVGGGTSNRLKRDGLRELLRSPVASKQLLSRAPVASKLAQGAVDFPVASSRGRGAVFLSSKLIQSQQRRGSFEDSAASVS